MTPEGWNEEEFGCILPATKFEADVYPFRSPHYCFGRRLLSFQRHVKEMRDGSVPLEEKANLYIKWFTYTYNCKLVPLTKYVRGM